MSSTTAVGDQTQAVPVAPEPTWYDDSVERYSNPAAYARKNAPQPTPTPDLQDEISLDIPGGQAAQLEVCSLHVCRVVVVFVDRDSMSRAPLVCTVV